MRAALTVIMVACTIAGVGLLIQAWRLRRWLRTESRRPRPRRASRHYQPPDRSVVVDGYTHPSSTLAAVCELPLPSESTEEHA